MESAPRLSAVLLLAAAALRGYRLARPGPSVLDRLSVVLAVVPACALLAGAAVAALYDGTDDIVPSLRWLGGYVVAAALALYAARSWRKPWPCLT
ncbi:hypothetical protein AB0K00_25265 [Dactylosporangium sp. NPDC049525]|uniref:hypothetical protein n=1 Tax=Dactylosporangium sp. NPDC049525 TaxID=3154730 RepID=UPI0034381D9C